MKLTAILSTDSRMTKTNNLFIRPAKTTCYISVNFQTYIRPNTNTNIAMKLNTRCCYAGVPFKSSRTKRRKKTSNACYDSWLDLSSDITQDSDIYGVIEMPQTNRVFHLCTFFHCFRKKEEIF